MKPGAIQMKAGKWYLTTAMRGYRPQKEVLNGAFISTERILRMIGLLTTMLLLCGIPGLLARARG